MNNEKLLKYYISIIFGIIFLASQILPNYFGWKEVFPLFHWSLFSSPPTEHTHFSISVKWAGETCELKQCSFLPQEAQSHQVYWLIQDLGLSWQANSSDFPLLQKQLENQLFKNLPHLEYTLILQKSNPRDFVLKKEVILHENLKTFNWP